MSSQRFVTLCFLASLFSGFISAKAQRAIQWKKNYGGAASGLGRTYR